MVYRTRNPEIVPKKEQPNTLDNELFATCVTHGQFPIWEENFSQWEKKPIRNYNIFLNSNIWMAISLTP